MKKLKPKLECPCCGKQAMTLKHRLFTIEWLKSKCESCGCKVGNSNIFKFGTAAIAYLTLFIMLNSLFEKGCFVDMNTYIIFAIIFPPFYLFTCTTKYLAICVSALTKKDK